VARCPANPEDEARELATEAAVAFGQMAAHYRQHYGLSPDEARARAAARPDHYIDRALTCPPNQVSWLDVDTIAQREPARALERWEEVKKAARDEVSSGHRAARAVEGRDSHCWTRAGFLAVRAELMVAWRPRNAAEQHLIDQLAQWQTLTWEWLETLAVYSQLPASPGRRTAGRDGDAGPPLLSDAEAIEHAAGMVERFQLLYLRTLRSLKDLRRLPPVVVRAAQVNIGQKQVNLAAPNGG
jgi:hypothetical protein